MQALSEKKLGFVLKQKDMTYPTLCLFFFELMLFDLTPTYFQMYHPQYALGHVDMSL